MPNMRLCRGVFYTRFGSMLPQTRQGQDALWKVKGANLHDKVHQNWPQSKTTARIYFVNLKESADSGSSNEIKRFWQKILPF